MDLDDVLISIFELQTAMFAFAIPLDVDMIYKTYKNLATL